MSCGLGVSCPLTVESACYCCRERCSTECYRLMMGCRKILNRNFDKNWCWNDLCNKIAKNCQNNDRKLPFYWVTLCVQSCLSLWLEYPKHRRWIEVSRLVFVGTMIRSILTSYVSSMNVRLVGISSLSSRSLHCLCKLSNAVESAVVGTGRSSLQAAVEFEMQCLSTLSKVEGFPSELWERRK